MVDQLLFLWKYKGLSAVRRQQSIFMKHSRTDVSMFKLELTYYLEVMTDSTVVYAMLPSGKEILLLMKNNW